MIIDVTAVELTPGYLGKDCAGLVYAVMNVIICCAALRIVILGIVSAVRIDYAHAPLVMMQEELLF